VDLYFVANPKHEAVTRECVFRVDDREPELWNPETGEVFALKDARQGDGRTTVNIQFGPAQSWFVVFPQKPTQSMSASNPFPSWKTLQDIDDQWTLDFDPKWGTNETLEVDNLGSWSEHTDPLVKYYSGTATYRKVFSVSEADLSNRNSWLCLDLGRVEVMARVTLNGKACGIAWKPPYRVDITEAIRPGANRLKIEVVNTWVNRMIGDEQLPLDAKWKNWETLLEWPAWFKQGRRSPTGRFTFTTARHYRKESPLMPAGLLGPVRIIAARSTAEHPVGR
jgi:hypothetical protein